MTFEINGAKGVYDGQIKDESERYGKNAVNNHQMLAISPFMSMQGEEPPILDLNPDGKSFENNVQKIEKFTKENDAYLNALPPLEYEYRYMPNVVKGNIDKKALLAAAEEEMGAKEVSVKDFEENYLPNKNFTAKPLDINNDGKITRNEYASSLLASDMLSKDEPDISKIDGSINSKGMDAVLAYSQKSRAEAAAKLYAGLYNTFKLDEA